MPASTGNARRQPEPFLTIIETARLLRLSERSTYGLARDGELPGAVRFGSAWRVSRDALMSWVERHGSPAAR